MKKLLLPIIILFALLGESQAQCFMNGFSNNASCDTACNGSIFIQFGTPAYPIAVTVNGMPPVIVTSAYNITNLCPGTYNLVAVDANGDTCTGVSTFMILQGSSPVVTLSSTNATCQTCNDGSMVASVTGGSAPYTYIWSNGTITQNQNFLSPGTYCITVVDANGCSTTDCDSIGIGNNGFYALQGKIYLDANSNGVRDVGEVGLQNQSVNIQPTGTTSFSNSNGDYLDIVLPGTYDVAFNATPGWMLTSSPSSYNLTVTTANIDSLDFGVYPDSTAGSATVNLTSFFPRCFWDVGYMINVNNNGFTSLTGTVELTYDPALTFVNSTPVPISHVGNVITFSFTNLAPGSVGYFNLTFTEPAGGTPLISTVLLDASDGFGNQISQSSTLSQTVSCAYDPNDKQVTPAGIGALNYVAMDEWLTYMIRFQNTGNDTAFKVVILDALDLNLDLNTFSVIGSSHNLQTSIDASRVVNFTFDNILLPDSNVNEPGSHGYVLYRIKGEVSNPDPSTVENTAYIIFDSNSPIVTNTTLTTFSDNFLGVAENGSANKFELFPNPMGTTATLRIKNYNGEVYTLVIYDLQGRKIRSSGDIKNGTIILHKDDLNSGLYILEITPVSDGFTERLRLIVK